MPAERSLTFNEMRDAFAKTTGVQISEVKVGGEYELMEPFNGMAKDITSWFNPSQNWTLTAINTALINRDRIAQSITDQESKKTTPDVFEIGFFFESDNPSVLGGKMGKAAGFGTNLSGIFASHMKSRVHADFVGYYVSPENVGQIYPLEQALVRLDTPYYLLRAAVTLAGPKLKNILVSVSLEDLHDYLAMKEEEFRNLRLKLESQQS